MATNRLPPKATTAAAVTSLRGERNGWVPLREGLADEKARCWLWLLQVNQDRFAISGRNLPEGPGSQKREPHDCFVGPQHHHGPGMRLHRARAPMSADWTRSDASQVKASIVRAPFTLSNITPPPPRHG